MAKRKSSSAASKSIAKNIETAIGERATENVYQLRISLDNAHLPIWRRIQTPDVTLEDLHDQIQAVMGWDNAHLHQFIIEKVRYRPTLPGHDDFGFGQRPADSRSVKLSSVLARRRKGYKFHYEYDFGDSWIHTIAYEGTVLRDSGVDYPRCIEGENSCPPEDVGGVWGYAAKLEALAAPGNHDGELAEWFGDFDPHAFDVAVADARMRPRRR